MRLYLLHSLRFWLLVILLAVATEPLWALTPRQALAIAVGDNDSRISSLQSALSEPNDQLLSYLDALSKEEILIRGEQVFRVKGDLSFDALTGARVPLPQDAEAPMLNNRLRSEIDNAMAALKLFSSQTEDRLKAIQALLNNPDASQRPLLEKAMAQEHHERIKTLMSYALAAMDMTSPEASVRLASAKTLGQYTHPDAQRLLNDQWKMPWSGPKLQRACKGSKTRWPGAKDWASYSAG